MKLPIPCAQCMSEKRGNAPVVASLTFTDDGRYKVQCDKGHDSIAFLDQLKFEVLFDVGAYALADGYYREAVSSFSSSLERFYEFFIRAVLLEKNISQESITSAWKIISNQSERQLGAYLFLFTSEFGNPPPLLSNADIRFRNEVIHKGKIPTRSEAIEYGQAVLDVIRPVLRETRKKYKNGVNKVIEQHKQICRSGIEASTPTVNILVRTIISLSFSGVDQAGISYDERTLERAIAELPQW